MIDRFDAMRAFVAVCDLQGFAAAARRLDLSPSAVTRLVAGLEQRLDTRLLQRTTRSVRPTDAGLRFLEHARRILGELEEAERSAQEERAVPRGRLVVTAPVLFGRMHVAPLVSDYLDAWPQAGAELRLSDRNLHLVDEGVDLAIRIGRLEDSSLISRRLRETRRVLVASPAYLRSAPAPERPSDLAGHRLIGFVPLMAARHWDFAGENGRAVAVEVEPHFLSDSGDAVIARALAGGGITAVLCYQVQEALRAGVLVEVLAPFAPPPVPIQAVFPTSRLLSGKVRAFLEILERAARTWALS